MAGIGRPRVAAVEPIFSGMIPGQWSQCEAALHRSASIQRKDGKTRSCRMPGTIKTSEEHSMKTLVLLVEKEPVTGDQWMGRAHIAVGLHVRDQQSRVLLSPDCVAAREVHAWADDLIKQLQGIKRQASRIQWDNHPSNPANRGRRNSRSKSN